MKAYFRGLVELCAANLKDGVWPPGLGEQIPRVSLYFENKANGYLYWSNGAYIAITDALFNYVDRYAARRGVPILVEP